MRKLFYFSVVFIATAAGAQELAPLTVEKIMADPAWIGQSPSSPFWSADSKYLLFRWNPDNAADDSVYYISTNAQGSTPVKTDYRFRDELLRGSELHYNKSRTQYLYEKDNDIFFTDMKKGSTIRLTTTAARESEPVFSFNEKKIVYSLQGDLYALDPVTGSTEQLIHFDSGGNPPAAGGRRGSSGASKTRSSENEQNEWLREESLANSAILRERKAKREARDSMRELAPKAKEVKTIALNKKILFGADISADGRYISYRLFEPAQGGTRTIIPNYVTESGYTEDINGRTKVGNPQGAQELFIYDRELDTVFQINPKQLPGITDIPEFNKDYPARYEELQKKPPVRRVSFQQISWSANGHRAYLDIVSQDNKDRWLMLFDPAADSLTLIDRQHDEAWIGGPGILGFRGSNSGWVDDSHIWYQSEASGYSHLYLADINQQSSKALTSGNYEVRSAKLSNDHRSFFISSSEVEPGQLQFYKLDIATGKKKRITEMTGANEVQVSPDEKWIAYLYSYSNKPWELYIQKNQSGAQPIQITDKASSDLFRSYPWRDPSIVKFAASDGDSVYARLYTPRQQASGRPAVIFVHGAGYLQNAHKWWSSYFREYMFHNLLADKGYTVLDIDYRGSAGYGRDWRTAIYRHMGGKDLSDQVDGARFLVENYQVDPAHIGIYGGSYGGFITLMAMFTSKSFAAGAGLRSVTDWAHYNHGYTSNILNEPVNDSIAYYRSSPINFAEGLQGRLLMCHGMVDVNVHFQDIVRLTEKLIELGKENWELAVYPVEDHSFVEPSSWTDEYKRILALFEATLR